MHAPLQLHRRRLGPAQPRALQCSCGRPLEARQPPADPCHPPPPQRRGRSGVVPSGPPRLRGLQRRSQCSQHRWHPRQGSTLSALVPLHLPRVRPRPWGARPSPRGSTACAEGSQGVRVRPQSCHVPPPSRASRQSWSGWVACPCDVEVASPGPHLPPAGSESGSLASLPGPRAPGTHFPVPCAPTPDYNGASTCAIAPPPPLRHTRAHTHRHGGISRPRAPPRGLAAVSSPVGLVTRHPGTDAQSGREGGADRG